MMLWRRLRRLLVDLARVNAAYFLSARLRNRIRATLSSDRKVADQHAIVANSEMQAAPKSARPYGGLVSTSLTLTGIRITDDSTPHVNLLIGEVREGGVFAGIHTALAVAKQLADRLDFPLRVVMLDFTSADNDRERAERYIKKEFKLQHVTVVPRESLCGTDFGSRDVWLASHWKTAHAVQVACVAGLIARHQVAYLIQDYEPGFSPWSTESVLAAKTYHAGFLPIVNSTPLWHFVTEREGLEIDKRLVFAPAFENERLRATAAARRPSSTVNVLFYARPSKHRNLYRLGIGALRAAVLELGGTDAPVRYFSAGEPHRKVDLGSGQFLTSLGRLPWAKYFDFLSTTQVALSLQQSPHPSHPPFDAAISGAIAVTNEFHGTRGELHPRIVAVPPDVNSLGQAIASAIRKSTTADPGTYLPMHDGVLGDSIGDVLDYAIPQLGRTGAG